MNTLVLKRAERNAGYGQYSEFGQAGDSSACVRNCGCGAINWQRDWATTQKVNNTGGGSHMHR